MSESLRDQIIQCLLSTQGLSEGATADAILAITQQEAEPVVRDMGQAVMDRLIHVGYTNPAQIEYGKEEGGKFYPDTENDCVIPLYMLKVHTHRLGRVATESSPPKPAPLPQSSLRDDEIQSLRGVVARLDIEIGLAKSLIEDPAYEWSTIDCEYANEWNYKLAKALTPQPVASSQCGHVMATNTIKWDDGTETGGPFCIKCGATKPQPVESVPQETIWSDQSLRNVGDELHNISCRVAHSDEDSAERLRVIASELWSRNIQESAPQDDFNGDNAALIRSAEALLNLDANGSLVPNGIGGHARTLLSAFVRRMGKAQAVPQGLEEFIVQYQRQVEGLFGIPCITVPELLAWMAGKVIVPVDLIQLAIRDIERLKTFAPTEDRIFINSTIKLLYRTAETASPEGAPQ